MQAIQFGFIPGARAGAMPLNQIDSIRTISRLLISPLQRLGLSFGNGRIYGRTLAIRRRTDAANNSMNRVPIPLGILKTL